MRHTLWSRFAVLSLLLCGTASAQVIWDMKGITGTNPKPTTQDNIRARPDVWPRLDQGAVLCKTEADLNLLAAARRGEAAERPSCQLIHQPTPIQIVKRAAPGRTQVSLTDQNGTQGWTDAWLPDRAPMIGGKTVTIK